MERGRQERGEKEEMDEEITVYAHNTYLLPSVMVAVTSGNKSCTDQHIRSARIGAAAQRHDVVALQEVWGSQVDKLDAALRPSHDIADGCQSVGSSWWGLGVPSVFDTLRFTLNANGGLWFAHRKELPCAVWRRHTFSVSETRSRKGATAALLDMSKRWGEGRYLLFLNAHLDPMNPDSKLAQIRETRQFLVSMCHELSESIDLKQVAVMLVGDFNIASTESLYRKAKKILGARDLYEEFAQRTGAEEERDYFTYDSVENSLVMWQERGRIDYGWAFDGVPELGLTFLPLAVTGVELVKQARGSEHSDHWAQVFTVRPANSSSS